ncbi:cadherin-like domain-containing protein, partial [Reichenbachiella sp.]|uniref:cadherin-like domain-containing protein n=1 Tax=Reichenbachiella sp. TaxID=2184521 RepID=UPI003299A4D8
MDYQNYLYLEYRRAIRKFRKLQTRFEKRIAKNTFQELTARRRHKLISQLNKLKQKIEQLAGRLKLAAAGGSLAFTMAIALDGNEAQAQGVPGVPKILSIDRTQANDLTTGFQQDPAIAFNNEGKFAIVWEGDDGDLRGKGYGGDVDESLNFNIPAGTGNNSDPAIAINNEDEFVVAWQESAFAIKYMRYEVEDGVLTSDGPYTATPGAETVHDPDVALDDNGNFVISWDQNNGEDSGIKARYYTAENVSSGVLDVTDNTNYDQDTPSVDMDNEGNFIVVWKDQEEPDPIVDLIRAQKYNKDTPVGSIVEIVQENENQLYTPDVDLNGDGSFVVAWENAANPGTTEYVRARMFDSAGTSSTSEISVGNRAYVSNPVVAADKDGGFVVAYSSYFDSYDNSILGSRYNRFGDVIESFQFHDHNEMYTSSYSEEPAIAMNDRGDFMVAWTDDAAAMGLESGDDEDTGVYFQQYKGKENEPYCLKEENQVNSYSTSNQFSPSIDVDASGNYVVVWEGDWFTSYESARGIIAQRYNSDGTKNGSEFQVNTTTDGNQQQPDVAMDSDGDFIVVWRSYDSGGQMGFDLLAQMFDADGNKNGVEFEIDQTEPVYGGPSEPSVDINDDGDAVVVWQSYGPQNIYARVITGPDEFLSNEFRVDASTVAGDRRYPDVAMNDDRSFVVTWGAPVSGGEEQTFIRRYDSNASALDANDVRISSNYNTQVRKQSIAMDRTNGDFTVAFSEYFNSSNRILASKYNGGGTSVFEEKVITESAYTLHNPHIASNSNGDFAISWDSYDGSKGVAFTVFDSDDEEIYGWDQIQNNATSDQHSGPTIALDDDSNAIVLYGNNSGGYNIFSKTIAKPLKGNIDSGIEFIVNSKTTKDQTNPDIAQNADGDFVVVWLDSYAASFAEYEIKAQRYNNKGIRQGAEMVINNETGQTAENPSVALTDDGDFMVVWSAYGSTGGESYDILGSVFDWAGNEIKDDFILNDVTTSSQRYPDVAVNPDGDFQVIWSDRSTYTENSILGQLVSADGIPDAGGNQVLAGITESYESMQPSIAINNDGDMAIPYIYDYDGVTNGFFVLNSSLQTLADNLAFGESSYVDSHRPSVTSNEDGDFVLAWSEFDLGTSIYELKVRKYVSGGEFDAGPVTIDVLNGETDPSIAAVDDGDFIISYTGNPDEAEFNVYLSRINSDFEAYDPPIQINEINASNSVNNSIASSPSGHYTVVWQSSYADGSDEAIVARQFVSHKPLIDNQGLTADEGSESNITSAELSFSNPSDNNNSAILTVNQLPSQGTLKLDGNNVALFQELDEDDMFFLSYEHDGSETTSDLFTFSVANADFETNNYTFSITVNPVNDEPDLTANH